MCVCVYMYMYVYVCICICVCIYKCILFLYFKIYIVLITLIFSLKFCIYNLALDTCYINMFYSLFYYCMKNFIRCQALPR